MLLGHRGPVPEAEFAADGTRRHRRRGRDDPRLGPGHEHRARAARRIAAVPSRRAASRSLAGRQRRRGRRRETSSGCGRASGEKSAPRVTRTRELRRVQPRRPPARQRGARPRRDRLGRRDRRARRTGIEEAQSASVEDARFSPDGRWLVTAGPNRRASGRPDGQPVRYLYGPKSPPSRRSPSSRLAGGRHARAGRRRAALGLRVLRRPRELETLAESRLRATGRTLTADERARYLG